MDAVCDGRSDGSRDEAGGWFGNSSTGMGNFFWGGANLGRPIVTNGDFAAYLCESA